MPNTKRAHKRVSGRLSARKGRQPDVKVTAIVSGVVVLLVFLVIYNIVRPRPGIVMPDQGNQHIRPPVKAVYSSYPPTSGPHYDGLAPWGIHDSPIPNELQVHNLEDGGVVVQYKCPDGCSELVTHLIALVARYDHNVILAPYPDMEHRIALTAWNRIEVLDEFDEERIIKFIEEYHGKDHHQ